MFRTIIFSAVFLAASATQAATLSSLLGLDEALEEAVAEATQGTPNAALTGNSTVTPTSASPLASTGTMSTPAGGCCPAAYSCCSQPINGAVGRGGVMGDRTFPAGGSSVTVGDGSIYVGGDVNLTINLDVDIDIDVNIYTINCQPVASACGCN